MTANQYLGQLRKYKRQMDNLEDLLVQYRQKSNAVPGQDLTQPRVDGTKSNEAPFVKWIYKVIETEEKIKEIKEKYDEAEFNIFNMIAEIENYTLAEILRLKYIDFLDSYSIAKRLGYTNRWIYKLLNDAVDEFEQIYNSKQNITS